MTIKAHYDGKVLVPDEPVDLPVGSALELQVTPVTPEPDRAPLAELAEYLDQFQDDPNAGRGALVELIERLDQLPDDSDVPEDGAAQLDHYLYGTPKRP